MDRPKNDGLWSKVRTILDKATGGKHSGSGAAGDNITTLISAFMWTNVPEKRQLLEDAGGALLNPVIEQMLRGAARQAAADGYEYGAARYTAHADLLANCRNRDPAVALSQFVAPEEGKSSTPVVPLLLKKILAEMQALANAPNAKSDEAGLIRRANLCRQVLSVVQRDEYSSVWAVCVKAAARPLIWS